MFTYAATFERLTDADTVRLIVDLGFRVTLTETFRLAGINAPERGTAEGSAATAFALEWFRRQTALVIVSEKAPRQEKYGRWLATIRGSDGTLLNEELVKAGHAVPYLLTR